ncbi:MAG: T9SS type A sorting domain-containing protein [Bacteroidales bacterium]|nr:T9SS type A sorting domain-containing protein [Bacteroidales bacterium]
MKKSLLIFLTFLWVINMNAQNIEMYYDFGNPHIVKVGDYHKVDFKDCVQYGEIGAPSMPYYSVRLLLPQGTEASSVEVYFSDFVEVEGEYDLYPIQKFVSYSSADTLPFSKNEEIYAIKSELPKQAHTDVKTHYLNGYAFAFLNFTPLRYVPSTGKMRYAKIVKVIVNVVPEKEDHSVMLRESHYSLSSVRSFAQNADMMREYESRAASLSSYDMLVVTRNKFVDDFSEYVDYYNSIGIRTKVVSTEYIYSEMDGCDYQEKIRNYIVQEYQNEGIFMVTIGGDVTVVPHRGLYASVNGGEKEDYGIPADMYYSCLDGNWNNDGDEKWGEIDEADLLPEIGISRLPFANSAAQAAKMIHKSLSYQRNPVLGEFHNIILGSEKADNTPTYGGDYLELIIGERDDNEYYTVGIPENYNFTRVYAEHGNWSRMNIMNAINRGAQSIHHAGHAGTNYVAEMFNEDFNDGEFSSLNGKDHNYTYFYSHGCHCASMDATSVMKRMVAMDNFCFAAIGNSREGWYMTGTSEGPSAHLHREMISAQYGDNISILAMALRESKIKTAPWAQDIDGYRWNTYCLNILGDGAVSVWLDEPYILRVCSSSAIQSDAHSYELTVKDEMGVFMSNFMCSMFKNGKMIGRAVTDSLGYANIIFEENIGHNDTLQLKVLGANAFPKTIDITIVPDNKPYVVCMDYTLNDTDCKMDFSESHTMNILLKNSGNTAANNITANLSCDKPEYVNITDSVENIDVIMGDSDVNISNAFAFITSDDVPNNTIVNFTVTITNGSETWTYDYDATIYAPDFSVIDAVIEDASGDGKIEAGESAMISFTVKNSGNSTAENVEFSVLCPTMDFYYDENKTIVKYLPEAETFTYTFSFRLDEMLPDANYELILSTASGKYVSYESYYIVVGGKEETFETGDFSAFDWQFIGNGSWAIDSVSPYQGNYCAKASYKNYGGWMKLLIEVEFLNDAEISFYKKISSTKTIVYQNALYFNVDDFCFDDWCGELDWSKSTYKIEKGKHVLDWQFQRIVVMDENEEYAMIDNIMFPPDAIVLDVKVEEEKTMSVYPNPTNGIMKLQLDDRQYDVTIYDFMGRVVKTYKYMTGYCEFDLTDMKNGMYFINIRNDNFNTTQKIIKR